jgi:hypothetical protein
MEVCMANVIIPELLRFAGIGALAGTGVKYGADRGGSVIAIGAIAAAIFKAVSLMLSPMTAIGALPGIVMTVYTLIQSQSSSNKDKLIYGIGSTLLGGLAGYLLGPHIPYAARVFIL